MELQWPLIIFTTLVMWSAGLFATQGVLALKGEGAKAQMKALITSVVLLAVGGIAVFFHLQHWERIFNGFGHLTSGITQELIAIVLVVIMMIVMFAYLRRGGDNPSIPAWVSVLSIVVAVILLIACGHSYMMAARPAWNSVFELLSLVGGACILGPATFAFIESISGQETGKLTGMCVLVGSIVNAVLTAVYMIAMSLASYTQFDATYFDPTHPTKALIDFSSLNAFSGDAIAFSVVTILGVIIAVVAGVMGRKQQNWKVWGAVAVIAAAIAAVCLRIVFYVLGVSVFAFY